MPVSIKGDGIISGVSSLTTPLTGITTFSSITATSITGVSTIGVTTVTATSLTVNGNNIASAGALSNRNIIINGAMDINQRGFTGAAGTSVNNSYVTDRFVIDHTHDGVVSAGQTSMNSTVGGDAFADGFRNALYFTVATADASLAASQNQTIQQRIEGQNLQAIKKGTANALPVTLSFWVRSTTTGTYFAELFDLDNTRQVSQAYTINVANTWEKKVLTFPADTVGAFDNDNALSLYVVWWLAAGSSYTSGTLNTSWATVTNANRAVGQTNLLATIGNNFFLTGVQLEVGSVETPFERRSYGQELALCQRYYQKYTNLEYTFWSAAQTTFITPLSFTVPMRPTPNATILSNGSIVTGGTPSIQGVTTQKLSLCHATSSATAARWGFQGLELEVVSEL